MSRLSEMEAFATVVEQGGFSDAARKMGVAKSTISKQVAALEDRLGVRLLNRTTRRVNPTEIGMAYYDRATRILNDAGEADAFISAMHDVPSGLLRISAASDFGTHRLAPELTTFLDRYPDITLDLQLSDTPPDLIENGFDIGLRIGTQADSSLMARKIARYRQKLVASPAYLLRMGMPKTAEDLARHRLLARSDQPVPASWGLTGTDGHRLREACAPALTAHDGQSLLTAVMSGMGIALLPDFLCDAALTDRKLVELFPNEPARDVCVYAVYPQGRFTQPKVRAFIDHLVEAFGSCRGAPDAISACQKTLCG